MNGILDRLRAKPAIYSLLIFLMMIIPSVLLFLSIENANKAGAVVLFGLVIFANLAAVFPPTRK